MLPDPAPLEVAIIRDIQAKTGLSFVRMESPDTRDKQTADAVLPVLRDWVPLLTKEANYRGAIYHRFVTPHAYPYLDSLLQWWKEERNEFNSGFLTHALVLTVRATDAERVWKLCQELPPRPLHYMLLAKLATFPAVEREVKDHLVQALQDPRMKLCDLDFISKVDDPRIRRWFEGHVDSPIGYLRTIARRVVEKGKRLPPCVAYASGPPDRAEEVYSTEVDLDELTAFLTALAKDYGLKVPKAVRQARFLASAELDRWLISIIAATHGDSVDLWFRLEDIDTVELVITKGKDKAQ